MAENTTDWTLEFAGSAMHDGIERLIDQVTPGNAGRVATDPSAFDDLIVVHALAVEIAEELLLETVTAARTAGRTWCQIGDALGITRAEAQARFTGGPDTSGAIEPHLAVATTDEQVLAELGVPERRLLRDVPYRVPVAALNEAGKFGWRMAGATIKPDWMAINVMMELTNEQWEHAVTTGFRKMSTAEGWNRLETPRWWGYSYWVRQLHAPALPGKPEPERFLLT